LQREDELVRQRLDEHEREAAYQTADGDDDRQALENVGAKFGKHRLKCVVVHTDSTFENLFPSL
jgi:hypothetical protein